MIKTTRIWIFAMFVLVFASLAYAATPNITTSPITSAVRESLYTYDFDATDDSNDTLTYSLITNPANMAINSSTGLISWTPTVYQLGNNSISIKVDDGLGGIAYQNFTLTVSSATGYVTYVYPRFDVHVDDDYVSTNGYDFVKSSLLDEFAVREEYMENITHWTYDEIYGSKMVIEIHPTSGCYGGTVYDYGTWREISISLHNPYNYSGCKCTYRQNNISKFGNPGAFGDYWCYPQTMLHETMHGIFPDSTWDSKWWNEGFASYLENTVLEHFGDINRNTTNYHITIGTSYYNWAGYVTNDYRDTSGSNLVVQSSPAYDLTAYMLMNLRDMYNDSQFYDRFYTLFDNNIETLNWAKDNNGYLESGRYRNDQIDTFMIYMMSLSAGTNLTPTFRYDGPSGPGWGVRNFSALDFLPDLIVSSMSVSNSTSDITQNITIQATVNNTAPFAVSTTVGLLSNNVLKENKIVNISAGSSVNVEFDYTELYPGNYTVDIFVDGNDVKVESDETNNKMSAAVSFTGNSAPFLSANISDITWDEDANYNSLNLSEYFSDNESDDLNYTSTTPNHITVLIDNDTGIVTLIPDADWAGTDWVIFTATDWLGRDVSSNNVTLTVNNLPETCSDCASCSQKAAFDNNKIILTNDIVADTDYCIQIPATNVSFDCSGFNLTGDQDKIGVWISGDDATIENCNIHDFGDGIYLGSGSGYVNNGKILNNSFYNSAYSAIYVSIASNALIKGNSIQEQSPAIGYAVTTIETSYGANITENVFNCSVTLLGENIYIDSTSSDNNIWLNDFLTYPTYNDGSNTQFCVNDEGNFYAEGVSVSPGDCGQANLTYPVGGENITGNVNITWTPQSSFKTINYNLFYSNDSGSNWFPISSNSGTSFVWNTAGLNNGSNYRIKIVPSDGSYNASSDESGSDFTLTPSCADSDNDEVCDSSDLCIGQNQSNIPANTTCASYSFNSTDGCHVTEYKPSGYVLNSNNCDSFDTACADYNTVYTICDGNGNITSGTCGSNITFKTNGFVINTTDCDYLDTECKNYTDVNNVCDGNGSITFGNCATLFTDEPITTQCGTDSTLYSCYAGNNINDDIYNLLVDQHCDGTGTCGTYSGAWTAFISCTASQYCSGTGNSTNSSQYTCSDIIPLDSDGDGVPDSSDSCPGTPSGESVNSQGCSCSQVTVDDNNICTDDSCVNGIVSHANNTAQSQNITQCGTSRCQDKNWLQYPANGYAHCSSGILVPYDCTPANAYSASCDNDLSVDELYVSRTNPPVAGSKTVARFKVTNHGANDLTNVWYRLETGSADPSRTAHIDSIQSGETVTGYINWVYTNSGTYTAKLAIDYDNSIYEFDETNNNMTKSITVN